MPANLTPVYYKAEENFKNATTVAEKIAALEEMLAVIPKHKGTEKIQADLKKRISKLKEEGQKKSKTSHKDPFRVERQGAGQVVLLGFPNTGKSSLLAAMTKARPKIAEYPYTTTLPLAGMMAYQDILIQLVDTPPITGELVPDGLLGTLRNADALLILMDAGSDNCLEQIFFCYDYLIEKNIITENLSSSNRALSLSRCLFLANKADLSGSAEHMQIMSELGPPNLDIMPISSETGTGLELLRENIFILLQIIRVYTKTPGKAPDMKTPFILKKGSSVLDLAENIHRDLPQLMKSARVWGSARYEGQSVNRDYLLSDRDIVEISR